jgi:hypothetical protein
LLFRFSFFCNEAGSSIPEPGRELSKTEIVPTALVDVIPPGPWNTLVLLFDLDRMENPASEKDD